MKKTTFALLVLSLITLAVLPAACSKAEAITYSTYTMGRAQFIYPNGWVDVTADQDPDVPVFAEDGLTMIKWQSPANAAVLLALEVDLTPVEALGPLTDDLKEEWVNYNRDIISILISNPTVVKQENVTILGEKAWETEFNGTWENWDNYSLTSTEGGRGYTLFVFHNSSMLMLIYAAKTSEWGSLGTVYDTIKDSITFQ